MNVAYEMSGMATRKNVRHGTEHNASRNGTRSREILLPPTLPSACRAAGGGPDVDLTVETTRRRGRDSLCVGEDRGGD